MKNSPNSLHLPLLITTGEPAGIGMDIVLSCLAQHRFDRAAVVVACLTALKERLAQLTTHNQNAKMTADLQVIDLPTLAQGGLSPSAVYVLDTPCLAPVVAGVPNPANALMVKQQLDVAHKLALANQVAAVVTAPLAKSVMIDGGVTLADGSPFSGHTEYFMQACGLDKVVMMLANRTMKVALVTTHLPLKDVPAAISFEAVVQTIAITHHAMQHQFGIHRPKILVCGLNPHAGENGHLGDEEQKIINPALTYLKNQGMDVSHALPADTLFTKNYLKTADVIIAMYHDQGLAPLKSHGFGETVNITLGLPYIRTSVDHGTAFDLAGTGKACDQSLHHAMLLADEMANTKTRQ